jgi:hypothetical protein
MILKIIATIILLFTVVFGGVTIYYKMNYPHYFACKNSENPTSNVLSLDIQTKYPKCEDGYLAYDVPFWGWFWKNDLIIGLIFIITGAYLWFRYPVGELNAK